MNSFVVKNPANGLIDWMTLILDGIFLDPETHRRCVSLHDRIQRTNPMTGEVKWESPCRENIRSDTHQITVKFGSRVEITGSPARIFFANNVFGSLDVVECALAMIDFVAQYNQVLLPRDLKFWKCSKIDVTRNYDFGSEAQCQTVLDYFKGLDYGRLKKVTFDTSVEFGRGSNYHRLKVYLKGVQCLKLIREKTAVFTDQELAKARKLLRLEYSLCRAFLLHLRENGLPWYRLTPEMLIELHTDAFDPLIGDFEVFDMDNILERLLQNVGDGEGQIPTVGQAQSAYDCYVRCRTIGFAQGKQSFKKQTFSRHLKNLGTIGIKAIDLHPSNVVPFRRKPILLGEAVTSWDDIKLP